MAIGVKVKWRTKAMEVPSLLVDEVERFHKDGALNKLPTPEFAARGILVPEVREAMLSVLCAAMAHNDVSAETVRSELDMECVGRVVAALMGASHIERKEGDAGEAKPQTP